MALKYTKHWIRLKDDAAVGVLMCGLLHMYCAALTLRLLKVCSVMVKVFNIINRLLLVSEHYNLD